MEGHFELVPIKQCGQSPEQGYRYIKCANSLIETENYNYFPQTIEG